MYLDIWEGSDYLLLGRQIVTLLELEITYRAGQGKISIHAAKVDKTTSSLDTCFFGYVALADDFITRGKAHTFVLGFVIE